ncbi:MAG: single-stranded-DNA-specific exonuclease RecJ [candidate division NC10 bacterium]|nr:single-stranded-DNA-specific exonuclease RecJ [candidate division NC10 bacterium]
MRRKWRLPEPDPDRAKQIALDLRIHPILAQILLNRGIRDSTQARAFLHPSLKDLCSPHRLKGTKEAVARLQLALSRSEKILLYGDYDVDGICGVALLWRLLQKMGGRLVHSFPHRLREGYGIKEDAIRWAQKEGVGLIVAIDLGITAHSAVELARSLGIDVIICDHHLPEEKIPPALAILDPHQPDCPYPFKSLAAVGVVFKLCQALAEAMGKSDEVDQHLDLVALGTIADVVPLQGENRILAQLGLARLQRSQKVGIHALLETANLSRSSVGSGQVAFILAPRLNAAGRMKEADLAFQLLTTESPSEAHRLGRMLEELNRDRQTMERAVIEEAMGMVEARVGLPKAICLYGEGWHLGVVGIVASRLVDAYHRPAVVISLRGGKGRGSARSIPAFPMKRALEQCADLLEGFGGHSLAAGFTIDQEAVPSFVERFQEVADSSLSDEEFLPTLTLDGEVSLGDLSLDLAMQMKRMEPYGVGNPEPTLACRGLQVMKYPRWVGENGEHVKLKVRKDGKVMEAIGFGLGHLHRELEGSPPLIDLAFCPLINTYGGNPILQLRIKDLQFPPS